MSTAHYATQDFPSIPDLGTHPRAWAHWLVQEVVPASPPTLRGPLMEIAMRVLQQTEMSARNRSRPMCFGSSPAGAIGPGLCQYYQGSSECSLTIQIRVELTRNPIRSWSGPPPRSTTRPVMISRVIKKTVRGKCLSIQVAIKNAQDVLLMIEKKNSASPNHLTPKMLIAHTQTVIAAV